MKIGPRRTSRWRIKSSWILDSTRDNTRNTSNAPCQRAFGTMVAKSLTMAIMRLRLMKPFRQPLLPFQQRERHLRRHLIKCGMRERDAWELPSPISLIEGRPPGRIQRRWQVLVDLITRRQRLWNWIWPPMRRFFATTANSTFKPKTPWSMQIKQSCQLKPQRIPVTTS